MENSGKFIFINDTMIHRMSGTMRKHICNFTDFIKSGGKKKNKKASIMGNIS